MKEGPLSEEELKQLNDVLIEFGNAAIYEVITNFDKFLVERTKKALNEFIELFESKNIGTDKVNMFKEDSLRFFKAFFLDILSNMAKQTIDDNYKAIERVFGKTTEEKPREIH